MFNAYWEPLTFDVPAAPQTAARWCRWIDTALRSPADICGPADAPVVVDARYTVQSRSVVVLVLEGT